MKPGPYGNEWDPFSSDHQYDAGIDLGWTAALNDLGAALDTLDPTDLVDRSYGQAVQDVKDIIERMKGGGSE